MELSDIMDAWNASADRYNQWEELSGDERVEFAIVLFTTKCFDDKKGEDMGHKYSIGSTVSFPGHEGQAEIMAVTYKKPHRYDLEYDNGKEIVYDVPEDDIYLIHALPRTEKK